MEELSVAAEDDHRTSIAMLTSMAPIQEDLEGDIQYHASVCYQPNFDSVEVNAHKVPTESLFKAGHHTPSEHNCYTFGIENIPISLITFGLHLSHPFYNSTQRSFRYTLTDIGGEQYHKFIDQWLEDYETDDDLKIKLCNFIWKGLNFYNDNIGEVISLAEEKLAEERPNFKGPKVTAARLAQEQARCIISTILPTGLTHTLDLVTIASMYHAAWNEPLKDIYRNMLYQATDNTVEMQYWLDKAYEDVKMDWSPRFKHVGSHLSSSPHVSVVDNQIRDCHIKRYDELHQPLDLLQFSPLAKSSKVDTAKYKVKLSIASFGQDQRHRTLERSNPTITDSFLVPPMISAIPKWEKFVDEYWNDFQELIDEFGLDKVYLYAPYGAMVEYEVEAEMRGLYHYLERRLCNCAQLEVSQVAEQLVRKLHLRGDCKAACQTDAGCQAGSRYCGKLAGAIKRSFI